MKEGELFDSWNTKKKELDFRDKYPHFKVRDIWFCSVGVNIGHEIDGKHEFFERPVLVIKKITRKTFLGVPLTSQLRGGGFNFLIELFGNSRSVLFDQIKMFDVRRLRRRLCRLDQEKFGKILGLFINWIKTK